MARAVYDKWWVVLLRGLLWIAFGIAALVWPGLTLAALLLLFGFFAIIEGIVTAMFAIIGRRLSPRWWLALVAGLLGIAVGVVAFVWPGLTALVLLFLIAIRMVVVGVLELAAGLRPPVPMRDRGWVVLGGIISIIFGVVLMLLPVAGALAIIWLIGAFAMVLGVVTCALSFRLRGGSLSSESLPV